MTSSAHSLIEEMIAAGKSFIKNKNNNGPKTES